MKVFAENALLPNGWAKNVLIEWDERGCIVSVKADSHYAEAVAANGDQLITQAHHLMPGLTNLHSHAFQRAMAGLTEFRANAEDSFWTWRDLMYRFAARITPDQLECIATHLYIEMLKAGYTGVCEFHYLHHDTNGQPFDNPAEMSLRILSAATNVGISLTHLPVLYQYAGFGSQPANVGQKRFLHRIDAYQKLLTAVSAHLSDHQTLGIAPHSLRAVNETSLQEAILAINSLNAKAPVHIHIAEQQAEVDACIQWSGQRPIEWLQQRFDVNERWCLVHATHINEQERKTLSHSGAVAGICTTTEANLGDGFFPIESYVQDSYAPNFGVWGVGSDSNTSVSPVEELRWLEYGARLRLQKRAVLCTQEQSVGDYLYRGALHGGARAAGRKAGKIAVGYMADLIQLDHGHAMFAHGDISRLLDSWIFSGHALVVQDVYVGGHQQVCKGVHRLEQVSMQNYQHALKTMLA